MTSFVSRTAASVMDVHAPAGERPQAGDHEDIDLMRRLREQGHPPALAMLPWSTAEWAVIVQPGSDSADLLRAVARMPAGLTFAESYRGVDTVLVYRAPAELAGDIDNDDPGPSRRGCAGAALRMALDLHPCRPDSRWMTGGERAAFQAGQVEALESVRRAILHALGVPPVS